MTRGVHPCSSVSMTMAAPLAGGTEGTSLGRRTVIANVLSSLGSGSPLGGECVAWALSAGVVGFVASAETSGGGIDAPTAFVGVRFGRRGTGSRYSC